MNTVRLLIDDVAWRSVLESRLAEAGWVLVPDDAASSALVVVPPLEAGVSGWSAQSVRSVLESTVFALVDRLQAIGASMRSGTRLAILVPTCGAAEGITTERFRSIVLARFVNGLAHELHAAGVTVQGIEVPADAATAAAIVVDTLQTEALTGSWVGRMEDLIR